jgi:hypothetical protein
MDRGTGEEAGAGGGGVDRRGQEEDQAMRIIERLRKLKEGAEETESLQHNGTVLRVAWQKTNQR